MNMFKYSVFHLTSSFYDTLFPYGVYISTIYSIGLAEQIHPRTLGSHLSYGGLTPFIIYFSHFIFSFLHILRLHHLRPTSIEAILHK